jgi:hypothetical protein
LAVISTASTADPTPDDAVTTVKQDVAATAAEATVISGGGSTGTSTSVTKDGFTPRLSGPRHRKPGGGLADAMKSVQDTINSSISKITDGLKGSGTTKGADTSTGGEEASTGSEVGSADAE